jgi:hypothetical protein
MLPGELTDHFLLTDITPPRNNDLPPSTLLIIKRYSPPLYIHTHTHTASAAALPAKVSRGNWIAEFPETGDPFTAIIPSALSFCFVRTVFGYSVSQCPVNFG